MRVVGMGGLRLGVGFPATIADCPVVYKDSTNFRDAHRISAGSKKRLFFDASIRYHYEASQSTG